ncbi:MAG: hypothetical protein HY423_15210 [Candidatus Lambdaproteobacteria bacterium]|nr:hypothetical protein [Candidatus Lambdaproteobacteria bacterium]
MTIPRRLFHVLLAAALAAAVTAGCTLLFGEPKKPLHEPAFSEEVDSVVVEPFAKPASLAINPVELGLFQKLLRAELEGRSKLRTYDNPPTRLPNTVRLRGTLTEYAVAERTGDGLFLRTVSLGVVLRLLPAADERPLREFQRRYAYQRLYVSGQAVPAQPFDIENAIRELVQALREQLVPSPVARLVLDDAEDGPAGRSLAHPILLKANRFARQEDYTQAIALWGVVLFDPTFARQPPRYRISRRTLEELKVREVPKGVLEQIEPMTRRTPLPLTEFQTVLRHVLGGISQYEPRMLELSDDQQDRIHRNLAAAHANLAALYAAELRLDLAAFHYARAYAHYREPRVLETWSLLQRKRNAMPQTASVEEALAAYLRIPAPATARWNPGAFDAAVLPPVAFPATAAEAPSPDTPRAPAGAEPAAAEPAGAQPAAPALLPTVQPVTLPPAAAERSGGALPAIEAPEPAGGAGARAR